MNNVCLICRNDKALPSSCAERLFCSSSIQNEPLTTLICCQQHCHMSCLRTAILAQRDCHQDESARTRIDTCIHCQKDLMNRIKLPFKNIREFKNHQKKLSDQKILTASMISFAIIFIIGMCLSITLHAVVAQPKYIELCSNSNLTIRTTTNSTLSDLCHHCLNGDSTKGDGTQCPSFIFTGVFSYILNPSIMLLLVLIISVMYGECRTKSYVTLFIGWGILCSVIRWISTGIYYGITLKSVNQIDSFDQLYNLQEKFALMDGMPLLLITFPIVMYIFFGIIYCVPLCCSGCKECTAECCQDCYKSCFHYSHHSFNNPIEDLSITINEDDPKKNSYGSA